VGRRTTPTTNKNLILLGISSKLETFRGRTLFYSSLTNNIPKGTLIIFPLNQTAGKRKVELFLTGGDITVGEGL